MDISLLFGALIAILGALIGVGVRRTTKFLYPYDFLSLTIYTLLIIGAVILPQMDLGANINALIPPITTEQYAAFAIGYFVGYCIDGKLNYIMVRTTHLEIKHKRGEPWVTYYNGGYECIAIQKNRALFNRLFRGIHVPIISNAPFIADWTESTIYPLFPEFFVPIIHLDESKLVRLRPTDEDKNKRRPPKRYVMKVKVAHGSMISKEQLCYEADAVKIANDAAARANRRLIGFTHYMKGAIPKILTNFIAEVYRKSPVMAFVETLDDSRYPFWISDGELEKLEDKIVEEKENETPTEDDSNDDQTQHTQ